MNVVCDSVLGRNLFFSCMLTLGLVSSVSAVPIDVLIDTTSLSGSTGQMAFDFIDGDPASNTATISGFTTDGTLVFPATEDGGPISGTLPGPVTIEDDSFFNELLQPITFGNTISFSVELTTNRTFSLFPDSFSFFLLDDFLLLLFPTSDPTFADSLFFVDIDGSAAGAISSFVATGPPTVTWSVTQAAAAPEPSTLFLLFLGFASLRHRRFRLQ